MARPLVSLAIALVIVLALFEVRTSLAAGTGIKLSPTAGLPGSIVTVSGTRFKPTEIVAIVFDATAVGTATANGSGSFTTSVTVPAGATPGNHVIKATGQQSGRSAEATYFVETSWPMYGFGPEHTGFNPTESVLSTSTVSSLTLDWSVSAYGIGGPTSVAVANGVVYFGTTGGVYAFDINTGATLWSLGVGSVMPSLAVANGLVYVGSTTGSLYALDTYTGAVVWQNVIGAASESAPTVVDGVVYEGWDNAYLYAFDGKTGARKWGFHADDSVTTSPTVVNGVVYLGVEVPPIYPNPAHSRLYALDAGTGAVLWTVDTPGTRESTPAVASGAVYYATGDASANYLSAFDAQTGATLWQDSAGIPFVFSPSLLAVAGGTVYLYDGELYAYAAGTGAALWHTTTGDPVLYPCSSPEAANGVVYVGSQADKLYAYNAQTGALLWSYTFSAQVEAVPAIVNGVVYVATMNGFSQLYAFHLAGRTP